VKTLRESAVVAGAVESQPSSAFNAQPEQVAVAPETKHEAPAAVSERSINVSQQQDTQAQSVSPSPVARATQSESGAGDAIVRDDNDDVNHDANLNHDSNLEHDADVQDLTGEWRIINTVEKTAYKSFGNMEVGFRLTVNQNGKEFTAKGEKFSENGQTLPTARRTPIQLKGSIDGDKVIATFVEDGRERRTNGRFIWKLQHNGDGLSGTFISTAANSRGRSTLTKQR
jgi:hypothetical protein